MVVGFHCSVAAVASPAAMTDAQFVAALRGLGRPFLVASPPVVNDEDAISSISESSEALLDSTGH